MALSAKYTQKPSAMQVYLQVLKKKNLEIATLSTQFKAYKIEINTQQQLYIAQLVPNNNIVTLPAPRQNEAQR